jgi:transposase
LDRKGLGLLDKERDQTLFELRDKLAAHGVRTNHTTLLWRFFRRHGVTRKKRPRTPANRTVPTL